MSAETVQNTTRVAMLLGVQVGCTQCLIHSVICTLFAGRLHTVFNPFSDMYTSWNIESINNKFAAVALPIQQDYLYICSMLFSKQQV